MEDRISRTTGVEGASMASSGRGKVLAISTSRKKGMPKTNVPSARLIPDWGMAGDAHAGTWDRQISLLAVESIDAMCGESLRFLRPGAMAENITTELVDTPSLSVGTRLRIGNAELELTQVGKECHTQCAIYHSVGRCAMRTEGLFAKVITGGDIYIGDTIEVIYPDELTPVVVGRTSRGSSDQGD